MATAAPGKREEPAFLRIARVQGQTRPAPGGVANLCGVRRLERQLEKRNLKIPTGDGLSGYTLL